MATLTTAQIQQAYVTFFSRPADPVGLAYWQEYTGSIANLYATFAEQTEYTAAFSGLTSAQQVNVVYQNLFGRDAEQAGLLYWAARVESGAISIANLALAVSAGSQGADTVVVESRVAAATAFTTALDTSAEILGYTGAAANAAAKTWLGAVTTAENLATATAAIDTATAAVVAVGGTPGETTALEVGNDDLTGTSNNDVFTAFLGSASATTYEAADAINGGAGKDTLNLVTNGSAVGGGLVTLDSVEIVNVRSLTLGTATTLDASQWTGVTKFTNENSLSSTTVGVSGLAVTAAVELHGETTVNVGFANTTTATDAVSVILSDAGHVSNGSSFSPASGSAAAINVDGGANGLITKVAVALEGTKDFATLEAGAAATTYTISGAAAGVLNTNDTITSFDASATTGGVDMTFSAVSDVAAIGGSGNDTFRFGTNYNNSDSVDGGAGTDAVTLTVAGFNRNLNTTNVENATVTFTETAGGILNASASTVTTFTLAAGSPNAASLASIGNAATITLNDDSIAGLTLDYVSGAAATTINVGSASGVVAVGAIDVTDVAAVTIHGVGSGAHTFATATFDSDVKGLTVDTVGTAAGVSIAASEFITLSGATTTTLTTSASGAITFGSAVAAAKLTTLTVNAAGSESADVTIGTLQASAVSAITLIGKGGADISLGNALIGAGGSATTKDIALTLDVEGASSDITVGTIGVSGQGTLTINLTQTATADIVVGAISLAQTATGDAAAANLAISDTSVIAGATAGIASIDMKSAGSGAALNIGTITVGANAQFSAGAILATDASLAISEITINVGASADGFIGAIGASAGTVAGITIDVGANASAEFSTIIASAMGAVTVTNSATGNADFGNITVGNAVGSIEISSTYDNSDVTFGTIGASAVGNISVSGAGSATFGVITSTSVGTVTSTQGVSGAFTINLSGVTNAVEVNLGRGTNTVTSGKGDDVITLVTGTTGNDTIVYSTAIQGTDSIVNFGAGSAATAGGADVIAIMSTAMAIKDADGVATTATDLSVVITAATALASADSIIVIGTALSTVAAMSAFVATNITFTSALTITGSFVIAWTDGGGSTNISVISASAGSAGATTFGSAGIAFTTTTLANLDGVTPGALVAANFDFV